MGDGPFITVCTSGGAATCYRAQVATSSSQVNETCPRGPQAFAKRIRRTQPDTERAEQIRDWKVIRGDTRAVTQS